METPRARGFDAFVSYSRAADGQLAPALQQALHGFAKPWYRLRVLHVFRDDASLSANPGLWSSIEAALVKSRYFILLASPQAARSEWVGRELECWRRYHPPERLLVVLTDGEIAWDHAGGDFDWSRSTAITPALKGVLSEEPRYVDLRWARTGEHVSLRDPRFRSGVADLAAPLHGRPKDELIGEDVRQHRRALRLARGAVATLVALTSVAVVAALVAMQQRALAVDRATVALSRQLAAQAMSNLDRRPSLALLQALKATRTATTEEATGSLLAALQGDPRILAFLPHRSAVQSVAFSPDGSLVAAGDRDGEVAVWDVRRRRSLKPPWQAHDRPVDAVAFSPDGRWLASGDRAGAVALWDVREPRPVATAVQVHRGQVTGISWSGDGTELFSAALDQTVRRLERRTDGTIRPFDVVPAPGRVSWIAVSRDTALVASYAGGVVTVQDSRTGEQVGRPRRIGTAEVSGMAFSPGNRALAVGDFSGRTWVLKLDTDGAAEKPRQDHGTVVEAMAWTSDGRHLVTGSFDKRLVLRDDSGSPVGEPFVGHANWVTDLAFQPGGQLLASGGLDGFVILWDVSRRSRLGTVLPGFDDGAAGAEFSPDGRRLAVTTADGATTRIWDVRGRRALGELRGHGDKSEALAWSPDGRTVATSGSEGTVVLWDVGRRSPRATLTGHTAPVDDLDWSPDSRRLATGGYDNQVMTWDAERGVPITRLSDVQEDMHGVRWVTGVAFHPDGRMLASAGLDGAVGFWDADTGRRLGRPVPLHAGPVLDIAFRPDGKVLASAGLDSAVALWDVDRGRRLAAPLLEHTKGVQGLAWSPDGHVLASTGGADGSVVLWNAVLQDVLGRGPLRGHTGRVEGIAFSPDGRLLVTTSDESVILWETSLPAWRRTACEMVRPLLESDVQAQPASADYRGVCE